MFLKFIRLSNQWFYLFFHHLTLRITPFFFDEKNALYQRIDLYTRVVDLHSLNFSSVISTLKDKSLNFTDGPSIAMVFLVFWDPSEGLCEIAVICEITVKLVLDFG